MSKRRLRRSTNSLLAILQSFSRAEFYDRCKSCRRFQNTGARRFFRRDLFFGRPSPADGEGRAAGSIRHCDVTRVGERHSADYCGLRPHRRYCDTGGPGGRQVDREMQQTCQSGEPTFTRIVGPMGVPSRSRAREKGGLRRRRPWSGADLSAGARIQRERRLCDRRARFPQQEPDFLGGQVPRMLRRADPVHR